MLTSCDSLPRASERALQEEIRAFLAAEAPRRRATCRARWTTGWTCCATGRRAATRPATSAARGRASSAAAAARPSSRSSSTRSSPPPALPSSSTSSASTCSGRRCCASAPTSSAGATSRRSSRPRRSGARASREPEAGSDLASLRTRAVEHDDHFVVSTARRRGSRGASSRAGAACSRAPTTTAPKHKGISMLIVDMRSPGVELRPMTQITGHAEFCELFLDDVVVPEGEPPRRARRRLEDRDAHARPRARDRRAPAPGQAAHLARPRGARRRRAHASTARR